jgi:hypothetical protein
MSMLETGRAAIRWLADQDDTALAIAREIISRRASVARTDWRATSDPCGKPRDEGVIAGLRLALSYVLDCPGSVTETDTYINRVSGADKLRSTS